MKTTKFLMLAILLAMAFNTEAQVAVKVDKKYGPVAPKWAPKAPATTRYYYLPDIQTYYDVPSQRYIYQRDGAWVRTTNLPTRYRGYDLYKGQTVYLTDYKGNAPYTYYSKHKVKYVGKKWKANGHDNGNHYGQLKGKGKPNGKNWNGNGNGHINEHENEHENEHGNKNGNGKSKGHGKK